MDGKKHFQEQAGLKNFSVTRKVNLVDREVRESFHVFRVDSAEAEGLLEALLPEPDRLFNRGEPLQSPWQSPATDKVRVPFRGKDYFLKRYNPVGRFYPIKNFFRPSRALKSWRAAWRFRIGGVPTLLPLVCLEERKAGLLKRSYVLFPFVAGKAGNLLDLWPRLGPGEREDCLERLAQILGTMHGQGILHGDLNWRNILAAEEGGGFRFYLVDLDGNRPVKGPSPKAAEKDLRHFVRDLRRAETGDELEQRFLSRWWDKAFPGRTKQDFAFFGEYR